MPVNSPAAGNNSNSDHAPAAHIGAIIVAAGLRQPKEGCVTRDGDIDMHWAPLMGRPVLAWTVMSMLRNATIDDMVVVVAPDRVGDARMLETSERWERVTIVPSEGVRRRDAVMSGLRALPSACQWVVVHDATRPLVTPELVAAGLAAAQQTGAAAASEPVKETIKRVRGGVVAETVDRSTLALLQTPQVFKRSMLLAAHQQSAPTLDAPDDATLAVSAGMRVATFPGSHDNLALTTPDDIAVAAVLLAHDQTALR